MRMRQEIWADLSIMPDDRGDIHHIFFRSRQVGIPRTLSSIVVSFCFDLMCRALMRGWMLVRNEGGSLNRA